MKLSPIAATSVRTVLLLMTTFLWCTDQLHAASRIPTARPGDSPWWHPTSSDSASATAPTQWGPEQNIAWKVEVPGRGHASPCIVGDQIFISTALEDIEEIRLLAYDRATGAEAWNVLLHQGGFMHRHGKNSHASGTPACDGERLFVSHMISKDGVEGVYLSAVSLSGEILWQKLAGPFITKHGYAPSPVLYGDTVIVVGDSEHEQAFVAAFDQATGDEVWRMQRSPRASFGCPTIAHVAGRDQLVIPGCNQTISYDPATGEQLWLVDGPSSSAGCTVTFDETKIFSSGGWPEKNLLAIRADGSGDVTESHIEWRSTKAICYVPTMLVHDGKLYSVSDDGVATCYDKETGDTIWVKRLGGGFSASPVLVGDNIYIPDEDGKMFIFKAADKYEEVATNDLADGGFATPIILGGKIYLRTLHHLYCIAN